MQPVNIIIHDDVYSTLTYTNLYFDQVSSIKLINEQHGYTKWKSCLTNFWVALDLVTEILENGKFVGIVFVDFAKAIVS